jgi:hypothetical protein
MPSRHLGDNPRLATLTRELADELAKEIVAVIDQLPEYRQPEAARQLARGLIVTASQILMRELAASLQRRHSDKTAIARLFAGIQGDRSDRPVQDPNDARRLRGMPEHLPDRSDRTEGKW